MRSTQKARAQSFRDIQRFMETHADALGPVNQSRTRTALDGLVKDLADRSASQSSAQTTARSITKEKADLRDTLRLHHMQPIAAIAQARLAGAPEITDLRLPARHVDDAGLVSAGIAMATVAEKYVQVFLDEQLPADFLQELRSAANAVQDAIDRRKQSLNALRIASAAVDNRIAIGRSVVRILNGLVVKQLQGNVELLDGWRQVKRVNAKPGFPRGSTRVTEAPAESSAPSVAVAAVASASTETPAAEEAAATKAA